MSYAEIVLAMVPAAPPTWKNLRATSWPAPISAKVPYFFASRFIWNAFLSVPISISAFIYSQDADIRLLVMRAKREALHPHSLGACGRDPATQIVRQGCVNPIAALAQNANLAAGRQSQDAAGAVRCRQAGFDFVASHNRQGASPRARFQGVEGEKSAT